MSAEPAPGGQPAGDAPSSTKDESRSRCISALTKVFPQATSDDAVQLELSSLDTDTLAKLARVRGRQQQALQSMEPESSLASVIEAVRAAQFRQKAALQQTLARMPAAKSSR